MAAPNPDTRPSDFKNLIPSPTGNLCDKIAKLIISLPTLSFNFVSWMLNEDGSPTEDFKTWICNALVSIGCSTTGGNVDANPNMPAPTAVSASDSTYSDKVRVTWDGVTPPSGIPAVTKYKIYRALSTVLTPTSATLLATVDAPILVYDDTSVVPGTNYNYWVVATNGTDTSNYGGPDVGNAASASGSLTAISDLIASQGFSTTNDGVVSLWWTPPSGATRYDIYRNTANDFATATKVISDTTPVAANISVAAEKSYDNIERVVAYHVPPAGNTKYYFWVIAKKDAPPAISSASNAAQGWVSIATDEPSILTSASMGNGDTYVVDPGVVRLKMVVYGQGGDGAGGGTVYGGGGGGASPLASIEFAVASGDTVDLVTTPNQDHGVNTAAMTSGANGATTEVKLNGVTVLTITGGAGGVYSASGGGAGGAVGSASGTALVTAWPALPGAAANGTAGGRGGAGFPQTRLAAAHYSGFGAFTSWEGNGVGSNGGGGSYAEVGVPGAGDAVGGYGNGAIAIYATFTA